jgi:hypothetical protein
MLIEILSGTIAVNETLNSVTINNVLPATFGLGNIFRNYSGKYITAEGEELGLTAPIRRIDNKISIVEFNSKTDKLKSGYTLELLQDAFAMYGKDYYGTLVNSLANTVSLEVKQRIFDKLREVSTVRPTLTLSTSYGAQSSLGNVYMDIYSRINKSIGSIGTNTGLVGDYTVTASSNVVAALKTIDMTEEVNGVLKLKNGAYLVEDGYSFDDYFTVSILGMEGLTNGAILYGLYDLSILEAKDPNTFETYIGIMNRDDIIVSPLAQDVGGKIDMSEITFVDFTNLTNY